MAKYALSTRSQQRLIGVHPDLVRLVRTAIKDSPVDFTVLEGLRTLDRQKKLVAAGASRTLNSRHLTGHAVDLAPYFAGQVRWDWPLYYPLADHIKLTAMRLNIPVQWGGDWRGGFRDGPHWELSRTAYPA